MDEDANTFPMDFYADDPSPHPWKFQPDGYLVVILSDAEEGERAEAALVAAGFAAHDVKRYPGERILETYEAYAARRNLVDKVVGAVVDDAEGRDLYLAYAREGACALWLRLPNEADVPKALRVLADRSYVHTRYYGSGKQEDFRVG